MVTPLKRASRKINVAGRYQEIHVAGRRKVLSPDHSRALIKEAIGIVEGDRAIQAEAAAEIAAIEAAQASSALEPRPKRPARR